MINHKQSPIVDAEISDYMANNGLDLIATTDSTEAFKDADYVIISKPTNYDPDKNYFDTSTVETVIRDVLDTNPNAVMVCKSTAPVGFTKEICIQYATNNIVFSPEFLRDGQALYDNLYPSRHCCR